MSTFFGTLFVIGIVMAAMAIGLTAGRTLKGSCGGQGGKCPCTPEQKHVCELKRRAA